MNLIGLIYKAKKLEIGMDNVIDSIKEGNCYLVIYAEDIGSNSLKKIKKICQANGIKIMQGKNKRIIGEYLGKRPVGLIGITDPNFASKLTRSLSEEGNKNGGGVDGKN